MKKNYTEIPNGYLETIQKGIAGVRSFSSGISRGTGTREENIGRLKKEIETADAIAIGAGAGLSTAAGFIYTGERFEKWFPDFIKTYGIRDMYSGGFYPYPSKEIFWAYWARYIYINRYLDPPMPTYEELLSLVKDKDYFVITTNVDHCFQKAGIDPKTVQYLAGHENSKVTMDIYAKAKYNKPEDLSSVVNGALKKTVKSDSGAKTGR